MSKHFIKLFQLLTILNFITPTIIINLTTYSTSEYFKIMLPRNGLNISVEVKVNNVTVMPGYDNEYLSIPKSKDPAEIEIIIHTNITSLKKLFSYTFAYYIKIKTLDAYITNLE